MKRNIIIPLILAASTLVAGTVFAGGEELYKAKCAICHPDGGNIMNKGKTLHQKDLAANKLNSAKNLVEYMRAPGPGMSKFDTKSLPDKDAKEVAEYILKTFK
jgi:cytochrome c6